MRDRRGLVRAAVRPAEGAPPLILLLACAEPEPEPEPDTTGWLEEGEAVTCADPDLRDTLGPFAEEDLGPDWALQTPATWNPDDKYYMGEALAIEDVTGDGLVDVLVPDNSALRLYVAPEWEEESAARIPALPDNEDDFLGLAVVTPADVDGDGDVDLVLGIVRGANRLLLNDGTGVFTDVPDAFPALPYQPRGLAMGDLDGDGDLELLVVNDRIDEFPPDPGQPNALYRNDGGVFTDVSDLLSDEDRYGYTKVGAILDFDQDGAQDVYIVNHLPQYQGSRLLFNEDGALVDAPKAGLDLAMSGMGLSFTDLDEDGLPDPAISGFEEVVVLRSVATRSWASASAALGVVPTGDQDSAWGNSFEDLDNDGRPDLFVAFGEASYGEVVGPNPRQQPDGFWHQQADGTFVDEAAAWGLDDEGVGRSVAAVDVDGDGWLDLLTHGKGEETLFRHARCGAEAWTVVRLVGSGPNSHAVGARVRVRANGRWQTRWVQTGGGLLTALPAEVHFGLGDAETLDRLRVDWPDGSVSEWTNVASRRRLVAHQGE